MVVLKHLLEEPFISPAWGDFNYGDHLGIDLMKLFSFGETDYLGWRWSFVQLEVLCPLWDYVGKACVEMLGEYLKWKQFLWIWYIKVINSMSLCPRNSSSNRLIKLDEKKEF